MLFYRLQSVWVLQKPLERLTVPPRSFIQRIIRGGEDQVKYQLLSLLERLWHRGGDSAVWKWSGRESSGQEKSSGQQRIQQVERFVQQLVRNIFTSNYLVYSLNFQVRAQKRLVEENCQSSRENSLQETSRPEEEFLIWPWWLQQIGLPCDHITTDVKISTKCEFELWTPVRKIFGFLQKYLDSWKKHISNLTAKMVCKNSNSPVLPLDTRTLLIYIWARTTLLLPVWINEHHTLGKLLLSTQKHTIYTS